MHAMEKRDTQGEIVLVAVLKNKRDLALLRRARWYRIPERYAPKRKFWYLAFYQPASFGRAGKRVRYYARVLRRGIARRLVLLPREHSHPRATERYVKLTLGALKALPHPIYNRAPRRVSFKFTTLARLMRARTILELYGVVRTEDILRNALRRAGITAIPQYGVRCDASKRYFLDFAIFTSNKKIAIECDNIKAHSGARQREKDRAKDAFLRRRDWTVLRFTERDVISDIETCIARIQQAVRAPAKAKFA